MGVVGIGFCGEGGTRISLFAALKVFVRHSGGRVAVKTDPSPHWKCQVLYFSNIQILSVFLAFLIFDPAIESAGVQKSTHADPISKSWP